jgi:hypothetical protein
MIAEAMGWSVEQLRKPFAELLRAGLVRVDFEARLIWLPNAMKYNPPANPNVVKGWASEWDELPECKLKRDAWIMMQAVLFARGNDFGNAFVSGCPEPYRKGFGNGLANGSVNGMPNQEQDQDQEQEKEQELTQERDSASRLAIANVPRGTDPDVPRETVYEPDPEFQAPVSAKPEEPEDTTRFDELVSSIAKAHPRADQVVKDGKVSHHMQTAILEAAQVEASERTHAENMRDAFAYLLRRTILYRQYTNKWPENEKRFIAQPVRFYDDRTYRQPEAQWDRGPGPGGGRRTNSAEEFDRAGSEAIAELRRRQADARNTAGDTSRQGPRTASELRPVSSLWGAPVGFRTKRNSGGI